MVEIGIMSAFLLVLAIVGEVGEWVVKKLPAIESWINSLPMMEQEKEEEQVEEADRRAA